MADPKTPEKLPPVELVATQRGFYRGRMVEPGKTFMFDPNPSVPGGKMKWPKWAKAAPEAQRELAEKAAKAKAFDTKPKDAAVASRGKAAQLVGGDLA